MSARDDGRGHWPAGKRRHPASPPELIERLKMASGANPDSPCSYRQLAWDLGVALTTPGRLSVRRLKDAKNDSK